MKVFPDVGGCRRTSMCVEGVCGHECVCDWVGGGGCVCAGVGVRYVVYLLECYVLAKCKVILGRCEVRSRVEWSGVERSVVGGSTV